MLKPRKGPHGLGGECADNFETGSRSAAAGGTTTMITFAPQSRSESDRSLVGVLEAYKKRAESTGSYIDYGFHMIIVRNDEEILRDELPILVKDWGVTSCKVFMTYEAQRLSDKALLDVMWAAKKNGITTVRSGLVGSGEKDTEQDIDDPRRERRCHRVAFW